MGKGTTRQAVRIRRGAAAAAAAAAILCGTGTPPVAWAHDVVLKADPPIDGEVENFPRHIVLEFSGIPKPSFNRVAVSDEKTGDVLFSKEPTLDKQLVSVDVPDDVKPGPGTYIIGFQITSSDGHSTRGKTTFTVTGKPVTTHTNADGSDTATSSAESAGPGLATVIGFGAVIVVFVGLVVAFITRKKEKNR